MGEVRKDEGLMDWQKAFIGHTLAAVQRAKETSKYLQLAYLLHYNLRKDTATFRSQRNCVLFFPTLCFPPLFLMYYQSGAP